MSVASPPRNTLRRDWEVLVVSVMVIVLALLLRVRADGQVVVGGLADYPLPPTCMSYALFGVKCPGCGLTRSLVHVAHGEWEASWRMHRVGGLLASVILLQFPYRIWSLRRRGRPPLGVRLPAVVGWVLIALLLVNWLWELVLPFWSG
jgi:hypothetical protein